ncbi:MAG: DNA polymerase III subunit epsilon [Coriobacteriaceae bacterium]|nr:MAG: DNA polymerase III subunit epsilon [Coriobacteriaceae bacterium]
MSEKELLTLNEVLLPNTPKHIREQYQTLAERAAKTDFGPLEDNIVVVDTETTGLSFKNCELVEIAAVRISSKKVVDTFDTFVHPTGLIPPEIVKLTHIRQVDVADAPSAPEAVAKLAEFVRGDVVLAHNAVFDRTFIESVPGGIEVSDNWIDTLALSRIALPSLTTHRLSDLAEIFGSDSVTHRSGDDVVALCGVWPIILQGLADLPAGLLDYLANMHPEVEWSYRPIFSYLAHQREPEVFSLKDTRNELLKQVPEHEREDANDTKEPFQVPSSAEIDAIFAEGGDVSCAYDHYEQRPEQLKMAQEVREALETSTHRTIEAGTGTGKSLAYLVPEILFAQKNNVSVGVATKTNALADQLISHELPLLNTVLENGVSYHTLKGWNHYPCLYRMEKAYQEELPINIVISHAQGRPSSKRTITQDMLTALAVSYTYVAESADEDLDAMGIRWKNVPRELITITSHECLHTKCPFYSHECVAYTARRLAAGCDVVVTNHSLLLRNVLAEGHILPPIRHWVIDEAHSFESEARSQWATEISAVDIHDIFEVLGDAKKGALARACNSVVGKDGATLALGLIQKASKAVQHASLVTSEFMAAIHDLISLAGKSSYEGTTLWINEEVRASGRWRAVVETGTEAVRSLEEASKRLKEAQTTLSLTTNEGDNILGDPAIAFDDLVNAINLIVLKPDPAYVYSAQLYRQTNQQSKNKRLRSERLVAEKLDIGQDLGTQWLPGMKSVIFTSATMAVEHDFSHFDHAVGLDKLPKESYKDIQLPSSFDFDDNMSVIVAKDLPLPGNPSYLPALDDLLFDIHISMQGSVLTLFTNRREMEKVYNELQPRLAREGLELIYQGPRSSPRQLRDQFIRDRELSLFALKSFWEGLDAQGDTLRCVVVPKLPFASPHDPLVQEREEREPRAWWRYQLPDAVLSVKQAAGRLIRTKTDTGVLVLCDSRLVKKRYGRDFIESMPSHTTAELETKNIGSYLKMWRASHERR